MSAEFYAMVEGEVAQTDERVQMSEDGSIDGTVDDESQDASRIGVRKKVRLSSKCSDN